jgi:hypothetical protein
VTRAELAEMDKSAIIGDPWPPSAPEIGQAAILLGFPGSLRFWTIYRSVSFGLYCCQIPITALNDHQLKFAFEKEYWVTADGGRLPLAGQKLGGLSRPLKNRLRHG